MIQPYQDDCICSSGFAVLSPKAGKEGIKPEVLLTYLRLPVICELLDLHTTATMYPAIPIDRLLNIPVFVPSEKVQQRIVEYVKAAFAARQEAASLLSEAKELVECAIQKGK